MMMAMALRRGKKCRPGRNLHSREAVDAGERERRTGNRIPVQCLHVLRYQQKGVFHRPGLQLAGVKCELVTEVRP